jgi:hypothetical protein
MANSSRAGIDGDFCLVAMALGVYIVQMARIRSRSRLMACSLISPGGKLENTYNWTKSLSIIWKIKVNEGTYTEPV